LSSILKALKKLENQATDQNHDKFWRPKNHIQNDDHEQINGHLRFKKGYVIIFAGLVLVAGAGLILSQKLYEKKPELIAKKETVFEKSVPLSEKTAAMPDSIQKELPFRKDVKKFEPITKTSKAAPPSAHKSRENTAVLFNQKTSPLKQTQKETVDGQHREEPVQDTKADRFLSMPVKRSNQTKIEVQAIAWASDPKSRLAVINGLILREGESIDNIIVLHIGKDAVVFRKGEEGWKQMFGF
jgi:hypothetical protein